LIPNDVKLIVLKIVASEDGWSIRSELPTRSGPIKQGEIDPFGQASQRRRFTITSNSYMVWHLCRSIRWL